MALNLPQIPFKLSAEDMGATDMVGNLMKGLQLANQGVESYYKPRTLSEQLLAQQLANRINKPKADNANEWYKAQLNHMLAQNGLIGAQTNEANLYAQNPLLKMGGIGGLLGAEKYLKEHESGQQSAQSAPQQGGWHDTGHGAGYDSGPLVPDTNSLYSNEASTNPSSGQSRGSAPDLNKVLEQIPKERRDALNMTLTEAMGRPSAPYSQRVHDAIESELNKTKTLNTYRQSLIDTAQKRASGGLTKDVLDMKDVEEGFMPGTNRQVVASPQMRDELLGQYKLKIQKQVSDTDTRKKVLFASNIDKTIDSINKKDLTRYAGLNGAIKLKMEEAKALSKPGSESESFRRYMESANKAQILAKQVRQFYGDSIQPAMLSQIQKLTNPGTWRTNPALAERLFDSFTDLLKKETGTYRGALKSPKGFEEQKSQGQTGLVKRSYNPQTGRLE